jgi:two-component system, chemotaxis family, chemotaxis protein CheY
MTPNILVVDDSLTIRAMIIKALRLSVPNLGEVTEADNGISALARLTEKEIHVVLTDINMPRMNGLQLIEKMKSLPHLANIPIVVISTDGSQERLKELEAKGVRGYLHKPFRPEELKKVLSKLWETSDEHQPVGTDECDF